MATTKFIVVFICLFSLSDGFTQNLMTIGEVFDFEIGDEFQYTSEVSDQPPNADRITITDKWYSANMDTVFYERYHSVYQVWLDWNSPPYPLAVENFNYYTDTISYHNLDSSITSYHHWVPYDSSLTYAFHDTVYTTGIEVCDADINGILSKPAVFEPERKERIWGRGIGLVWDRLIAHYNGPAEVFIFTYLIYYKKNGVECGTEDLTSISAVSATPESKTLIKVVDLLGRDTEIKTNKLLLYMYSDGSIEKKYKIP